MSAKERQKQLEHMYLSGVQNNRGLVFSVETLLDVLVVLFDECCSSNLRREKTVTEFVEYGKPQILLRHFSHLLSIKFVPHCSLRYVHCRLCKILLVSKLKNVSAKMKLFYFSVKPVVSRIKNLRLQREDFETLKIIGRGAFGEVITIQYSH